MMATFERLKVLHDYRTASTLRGYAYVFLTLAPIFISPSVRANSFRLCTPSSLHNQSMRQFALLAQEFGPWSGFGTAFFATLMFVTLANVQDFLEDPFVRYVRAAHLPPAPAAFPHPLSSSSSSSQSGFGVDAVNLDILHEINKHMF
jgi:hypothetical protein